MAGDDAVSEEALLVQPEVTAAMGHEGVELDEAVRVQQQLQPLARGQLALGVLLVDAFLSTAEARRRTHLVEALDLRLVLTHSGLPPGPRFVTTNTFVLDRTAPGLMFGGSDISTTSTDGTCWTRPFVDKARCV